MEIGKKFNKFGVAAVATTIVFGLFDHGFLGAAAGLLIAGIGVALDDTMHRSCRRPTKRDFKKVDDDYEEYRFWKKINKK